MIVQIVMQLQDNGFPSEEVEKCIQDSVEQVLAQANWEEKMVPQWINDICEKSMKQLLELNRPYKFLSTFTPLLTHIKSHAC